MKTSHKLFFAIPFDTATKKLYDRVCKTIRKQYPTVTTVIGIEEVGPSPKYSDIASFKAQNSELNRQFVTKIQEADIVIADLTHNNPNVHVELGIALIENKNILRVTGRSVTELGFDIRNLEVRQYKNQTQLIKTITNYLDTFFEIKKLPINNQIAQLYFKEPNPIHLLAIQKQFEIQPTSSPDFKMRDGAVNVEFEILSVKPPDNWFGVYFRAGASPLMGSHLLYVRQSGSIEIAVYPGPRVIEAFSAGPPISGRQTLTVQFENNWLELQLGDARYHTDKLTHQTAGRVFVAAWFADVDVRSVAMICRDTIEWA